MRTSIILRLLIAAAFCAWAPAAHAQKNKSVMQAEINANFPDQSTGAITPAIARTTFTDMVNSWQQYTAVNAQVGTTYAIVVGDYGNLITFSNASPVAVSIPQAVGSFSIWNGYLQNAGAGAVTVTPGAGSTICGASTLVLNQNQSAWVVSNGTDYKCQFSNAGQQFAIPFPVSIGGTNCTVASGTCLDNITGFAGTGFLTRTGSGTYAFQSTTNGITLANLAQTGANTMLSNWTSGTANVAANTMPSCPDTAGTNNHLSYVNGTGVTCGTLTGSMVLLNTLTASGSATLSDTTSLTATYSSYVIIFTNLICATANQTLQFQVRSGGTFKSSAYVASTFYTSGAAVTNVAPTAFIQASSTTLCGNAAGNGISGKINVSTPSQTSDFKNFYGEYSMINSGSAMNVGQTGGSWTGGNGAVDGIQFLFSSGNITSGNVKIYGVI